MTDATSPPGAIPTGHKHGSLFELDQRTKARNAAEWRFQAYGIAALAFGLIDKVIEKRPELPDAK